MNKMKWFSAMLHFVILIGNEGAITRSRSVVVVRASDWPEAKKRVLEVGRSMEEEFTNSLGEVVKSKLETVETLDLLGDSISDGREIYSESVDLAQSESIPSDAVLEPENSQPGQSGV